jgi:hypothetical protein
MIKAAEVLVAWVILWFVSTAITGLPWIWPVVFVVLCAWVVGSALKRGLSPAEDAPAYMSNRAVADVLGVSDMTVHRDLATPTNVEVDLQNRPTLGEDGKAMPEWVQAMLPRAGADTGGSAGNSPGRQT